jgi:hypothetical protein
VRLRRKPALMWRIFGDRDKILSIFASKFADKRQIYGAIDEKDTRTAGTALSQLAGGYYSPPQGFPAIAHRGQTLFHAARLWRKSVQTWRIFGDRHFSRQMYLWCKATLTWRIFRDRPFSVRRAYGENRCKHCGYLGTDPFPCNALMMHFFLYRGGEGVYR